MRMMGVDSVEYHEHTVAGRGDDPVHRGGRLLRLPGGDTDDAGVAGAVVCWAWTARWTWPSTGPCSGRGAPMTR